ncbi:MAG: integron integrase [FCB group bacterium]|nr:integron integrase [FCB group bacterium]
MENKHKFRPNPRLKLMEQVRQVMRYHHYAYRTEKTYCDWILRYIKFHGGKTHPKNMGKNEIEAFLSHLATHGKVAAATQRQALNAIVFLYHKVLDIIIEEEIEPIKAKRHRRPPVVMSQSEVQRVLNQMHGKHLLMARLLYGSGLRLMECIRLRVQDLDFERNLLYLRAGKGDKDRTTLFPQSIQADMQGHMEKVKKLHKNDLLEGFGEVYMPEALARKYRNAPKDFRWQYVFQSKNLSTDPRTGKKRRHHVLESGLQKAVKRAVDQAGITKRVGCHTFRHSFATHMLENGVNIRVVQELMGHANIKTTEIYLHVMEKSLTAVASPLDTLEI